MHSNDRIGHDIDDDAVVDYDDDECRRVFVSYFRPCNQYVCCIPFPYNIQMT